MHVKICGITDLAAAEVAVEAGADAVGFVFADSVRKVSVDTAAGIARDLPGRILRVAVFLRPDQAEVRRILSHFPADLVQADFGTIQDGVGLLPVFREGDDDALKEYLSGTVARRFHYEGRSSGAGEAVDWQHAARFARKGRMTLAGGLTPANVAIALETAHPFGVDVSSGVEAKPGVKDHDKIRDFISAVRNHEKESVNT